MRKVERITIAMAVAIAGAGALSLLNEGCPSSSSPHVRVPVETPSPATLMSARGPGTAAFGARMHDHDVHGAAMRDAVARGDLEGARREATVLAELRVEGAVDPAWHARLEAMSLAAARVARATDLPDASAAVAAVARTCGDCHRLGGPSMGIVEEPDSEPGTVAGMKRHQWAAARLWDGLVVPSDRAWRAGAHVLRDAPLQPEPPRPGESPLPAMEQLAIATLATSVHDLGERASVANASVDRGVVYGELLGTCAACHARLAQRLR